MLSSTQVGRCVVIEHRPLLIPMQRFQNGCVGLWNPNTLRRTECSRGRDSESASHRRRLLGAQESVRGPITGSAPRACWPQSASGACAPHEHTELGKTPTPPENTEKPPTTTTRDRMTWGRDFPGLQQNVVRSSPTGAQALCRRNRLPLPFPFSSQK